MIKDQGGNASLHPISFVLPRLGLRPQGGLRYGTGRKRGAPDGARPGGKETGPRSSPSGRTAATDLPGSRRGVTMSWDEHGTAQSTAPPANRLPEPPPALPPLPVVLRVPRFAGVQKLRPVPHPGNW